MGTTAAGRVPITEMRAHALPWNCGKSGWVRSDGENASSMTCILPLGSGSDQNTMPFRAISAKKHTLPRRAQFFKRSKPTAR